MNIAMLAVAALFFMCGCSKPAAPEKDKAEELIVEDAACIELSDISRGIQKFLGLNTGANGDDEELLALVNMLEINVIESAKGLGGANGNEDATAELWHAKLRYKSVDANGDEASLSADLYYPKVQDSKSKLSIPLLRGIVLNCHATQPQGMSQEAMEAMNMFYSVKGLALKGYLVLEPDYIGFGDSADKMQTYLAHHLIARNCVDALLTTMEMAPGKGISFLGAGGTYVLGYSQGGGNALAVTRYITKELDSSQKELICLKNTFCGAGPYDPKATFDHWVESDSLSLSAVLPMVLFGHKEVYPDLYKNIEVERYFSQEYVNTGVIRDIRNHNLDLMSAMADDAKFAWPDQGNDVPMPWVRTSVLMSTEAADKKSAIMQSVYTSLAMEDVTNDWTPETPVTFFASRTDNVVPFVNTSLAYDRLKAKAPSMVQDIVYSDFTNHITAQLGYTVKVFDGYFLPPSQK